MKMVKRMLLVLALACTLGNITAGVVHSAICQSTGGSRACGTACETHPSGGCLCTGGCTAAELAWVDGAKKDEEELLAE
jgi:hypothetical protein